MIGNSVMKELNHLIITQNDESINPAPQKYKYRQVTHGIKNIVVNYNNSDIIDKLSAIS